MTVETVSFISDLNASYPASGDSLVEGDDHIRNLKTGIKATFPNISGAVTLTHTAINALLPSGLVLLSSSSASASAAIDFTSSIDSTYDEYELHIINAIPGTDTDVAWLRTSANAGSSWDSGSGDYDYVNQRGVTTTSTVTNGSTTATKLVIGETAVSSTASNGGFNAVVRIFDPAGTASHKRISWNTSSASGAGLGNLAVLHGTGRRAATAAINGIRFLFSTGTIASGKFKLYGVKK